jgi:hypothetical protein
MCPRAGYHWFECCTDDQKEISFNGRKPCMRPKHTTLGRSLARYRYPGKVPVLRLMLDKPS